VKGGRPLLLGYAGIAGFLALEAFVRPAGGASSLRASTDDQATTRGIVRAFAVGLVVPAAFSRLPLGRASRLVPLGLVLEGGGLALRWWSMRTLGEAYSRTLRTGAEQPVAEAGPYAVIRHPGYLGSLLAWTGFGLTSGSVPGTGLLIMLFGRTYHRRIEAEEALLTRELPGYAAYRRRTWRLVPLVW
jgi:protein-S-isoprenylcysteine O-methyltransferase Ste14